MNTWAGYLKVDGWNSEYDSIQRILRHYARRTRSESTRRGVCDTIYHFLVFSGLDPVNVLDLDQREASQKVQSFLDSMFDRGLSRRTLNTNLAYLKQFFRVNGFKNGRELEVERYHMPARSRTRDEYIPTYEEIWRMANASGSTQNRAIILSLYTSGLRNSTLRALRIKDVFDELVEFKEGNLDVVKVPVYPEMKELVPDACKGRVPYYSFISREACEALWGHLTGREVQYGDYLSKEPLFISTSTNFPPEKRRKSPVKKTTLAVLVKRAARNAGVEEWKNVYPHCLRKAFESALRNNRLDYKDQEFLMGHILPGSQDTYYDRSKTNVLRHRYSEANFFPLRRRDDIAEKRIQLIQTAQLMGFDDQRLKRLQEALMRTKTINEGIIEFRNLRDSIESSEPSAKIVVGDDELLEALNEGWEIVQELNGERFLMRLTD
jgi:integrase